MLCYRWCYGKMIKIPINQNLFYQTSCIALLVGENFLKNSRTSSKPDSLSKNTLMRSELSIIQPFPPTSQNFLLGLLKNKWKGDAIRVQLTKYLDIFGFQKLELEGCRPQVGQRWWIGLILGDPI